MIREEAEIIVLGAGFAGSLMAMLLRKMGRSPLLIERGSHPRFAIGESSTPLANLTLERLCRTYDLPSIEPLCKYGSWQQSHPELACGLKRGFSFFKHQKNLEFAPRPDHANELLVAASPSDDVGDTHWYHEHFDFYLLQEAQKLQIPYFDNIRIEGIQHENGWLLRGRREQQEIEFRTGFLIDASGASSVLAKALGVAASPEALRTSSWSIFNHFFGVELWQDVMQEMEADISDHPYPCDAAALHHIFDDGWMWVLRFNNGLTSAGFVISSEQYEGSGELPATLWRKILAQYPSVERQFARAEPDRPFTVTARLQRRIEQAAGEDWAILPHSAYLIDPLLSAGNAHTLLGVERLARIIRSHWGKNSMARRLATYNAALQHEITFLDHLIHGCYRAFPQFDLLTNFSMYYFAGAIWSETRYRKETAAEDEGFLFSHDASFRKAVDTSYELLLESGGTHKRHISDCEKKIVKDIAPYNVAGLCDHRKRNMYPFTMG